MAALLLSASLAGMPAAAQSTIGNLPRGGAGNPEGAPASCGPAEAGATCGTAGPAARNSGTPIQTGAGNPVNVITGNKYQREVDLPALPGVLGLELVRHYNSGLSGAGHASGTIGRGWRLSYDTDLFVRGNGLHLLQADGSRLIFDCDADDPNTCAGNDPSHGRIRIRAAADGPEYTWHWPEGRQLLFNSQGRLVQILAPTGEFVSLQRAPNGNLLKVTDPQGRSLQLRYLDREAAARNDRYKGVVAIDTPVGEFRYEYGSEPPAGSRAHPRQLLANLVRVHLPASYDHANKRHAWTDRGTTISTVTRHYHYEDPAHPTLLTGISVSGAGSDGKPMRERISTYAYDAAGKGILSVKGEPLRRDGQGKPVPGTGIEQVSFDRSRPGMTVLTNGKGQKTSYKHAIIGGEYRLTEIRGAGCETCGETDVRYGYDRVGRLVGVTRLDGMGNPRETIRYELDGQGRKRRIAKASYLNGKPEPAELLAQYEYSSHVVAHDQPSSISHPSTVPGKQYQARISYNDHGQPLHIVETGWTPGIGNAAPVEIKRSTSFEYVGVNGRSLLAAIRQDDSGDSGDSPMIRFEYDARGSYPVRMTTADGETTDILERTPDGRPRKVRTGDGKRSMLVTAEYLPGGQVRRISQTALEGPAGDETAERKLDARYDALARLTELRLPAQVLQLVPGLARPTSPGAAQALPAADAEHQRLLFRTGEAGSIAEREVIEIAFNSGTNAGILATRWLDDFGRLVALQYRGQGITRAQYDGASNRIRSVTDGVGNATRLQYDRQGRLRLLERFDNDGKRREWIEYRHEGRLLIEQARYRSDDAGKPGSIIRRTYNAFGQVIREYQQSAGVAYAVNHEYDAEGRIGKTWIAEQTSDGSMRDLPAIRYRYRPSDKGNRPLAIEAESGWFGNKPVATAIEWLAPPANSADRATTDGTTAIATGWRLGNGLSVTSDYRHSEEGVPWRLSAHRDGVHEYKITADPEGRILASIPADQTRLGGRDRSLKPATSLTEVAVSPDIAASRASTTPPDVQSSPADHDMAGRQRTFRRGELEYRLAWTGAGEIEEIRQGDVSIATYRYDAEGRRVSKHVAGRPAENRRFIYSGKQLVAEADDQGRVIRQYITLGWRPIAWMEPARGIGERIRQFASGPKLIYLHTDHRGAATAATDDEKVVRWSSSLNKRGHAVSQDGQSGQFEQPLRLVNQYADNESGLHYNLARYYDPATGNFLSPDPAGFDAGYIDLYAYANGDMLNLVDPDGWATIRYYAIDEGIKLAPNVQPNKGRWAFVLWGIKGHEDRVLVYDKGGSFLERGMPSKLHQGPSPTNILERFATHYASRDGYYSPAQFTVDINDVHAAAVVKALTGESLNIKPCPANPKVFLPPIDLGLQGRLDPMSTSKREPNRIIRCDEEMEQDAILLKRIQKAIEIHEVKASGVVPSTDKDCGSAKFEACPAETWNPAVKPATNEMQPASYGWIQFTPIGLVDALRNLSESEMQTLALSKGDLVSLERNVSAVQKWFGLLVKNSKTGAPVAELVSAGWEANKHIFQQETGLGKENYDRMVAFGKIAEILRAVNKEHGDACQDSSACYWRLWEEAEPDRVRSLDLFALEEIGASRTKLNPYVRNPRNVGEARAGFQWAAIFGSRIGKRLFKALSEKGQADLLAAAFLRTKFEQARRREMVQKNQKMTVAQEIAVARTTFYFHNGDRAYANKVMPHFNKIFCVGSRESADEYLSMEALEIR